MPTNVHALFYSQPAGLGFGFAQEKLQGLFENRELAEKRLLEIVLDGGMIASARIDELVIEQPSDPKNPLNYPEVIASLIEFKKIQAIKALRERVDGLYLKEAKDLVEAVELDKLPEDVRLAALKVLEDREEAKRQEQREEAKRQEQREAARRRAGELPGVGEKVSPKYDWMYSTWLIDDDGDRWAHVGEGNYVMVNIYGERDHSGEPQSYSKIEDCYGITDEVEDTPSFEERGNVDDF